MPAVAPAPTSRPAPRRESRAARPAPARSPAPRPARTPALRCGGRRESRAAGVGTAETPTLQVPNGPRPSQRVVSEQVGCATVPIHGITMCKVLNEPAKPAGQSFRPKDGAETHRATDAEAAIGFNSMPLRRSVQASWSRAHSPRRHPASAPVFVHRPAILPWASASPYLTATPWPFGSPPARQTPGVGAGTRRAAGHARHARVVYPAANEAQRSGQSELMPWLGSHRR